MYIYSTCLIPLELILTLGLEGIRWHINTQEKSFLKLSISRNCHVKLLRDIFFVQFYGAP